MIGNFKLDYEIKEAYFISNKTYCLVLNDGKTVIKTKGIINKSINLEDFKTMYWNNSNVTWTKINTSTNYEKACVLIDKKSINLNYNSYIKREKIYDKKGIWINTKPLNIKN